MELLLLLIPLGVLAWFVQRGSQDQDDLRAAQKHQQGGDSGASAYSGGMDGAAAACDGGGDGGGSGD